MRSTRVAQTLLLLLTLFGCQKNDMKDAPPAPPPPPVTGQIVLPEGSTLSGVPLTVTNGVFESSVNAGEFTIDTSALSNTFSFVTDEQQQPYLIKYYDATGDQQISAHSTALALIMSSPVVSSLTFEGKQDLLQFITATTEFATLENEVKENVRQGKPITDTANTALRDALLAVFDKTAAGGSSGDTTSAILVEQNGKTISIANNGAANAYVAGVYRDGQRINNYVIRGTARFAFSPVQAISGVYTPFISGDRQNILMDGDGRYEVKIRSGNPAVQDGSQENYLATRINVIDVAWSFATRLLPSNLSCLSDVKNDIEENYDFEMPSMSGSLFDVSNAVYTLADKIISDNIERAGNCYDDATLFSRYAKTVTMFVTYLSSVSRNASNGINVTPQLYHLYYNQQQFDFCYTVSGDDVTDCNAPSLDTFTYNGFYAVPGTTIGAAIEFRLNFNGENVTGYATSLSFDYGSNEQTVPVTGTLKGNTMQLTMHMDNGIVPDMVDCVPQPAPHCASCRYTGDHVVQDWVITGTVNEDHSTYNAEYSRMIKYTSLVTNPNCTTSTVVDDVEENGVLAY